MLPAIKIPYQRVVLGLLSIIILLLTGCIQDTNALAGTASNSTTPMPVLVKENMAFDVRVFRTGNGVCSPTNVVAFDYKVTAPAPGLLAVLAGNKAAYDALLPADLADPSTANLPAPLLDMSCTTSNVTLCEKTFPANRKLKPQIMCILLKKEATDDDINAHVDVTWYR